MIVEDFYTNAGYLIYERLQAQWEGAQLWCRLKRKKRKDGTNRGIPSQFPRLKTCNLR